MFWTTKNIIILASTLGIVAIVAIVVIVVCVVLLKSDSSTTESTSSNQHSSNASGSTSSGSTSSGSTTNSSSSDSSNSSEASSSSSEGPFTGYTLTGNSYFNSSDYSTWGVSGPCRVEIKFNPTTEGFIVGQGLSFYTNTIDRGWFITYKTSNDDISIPDGRIIVYRRETGMIYSEVDLPLNQDVTIVYTYDGTTMRLYFDDVLVASGDNSETVVDANRVLLVGVAYTGGSPTFENPCNGLYKSLKIWSSSDGTDGTLVASFDFANPSGFLEFENLAPGGGGSSNFLSVDSF